MRSKRNAGFGADPKDQAPLDRLVQVRTWNHSSGKGGRSSTSTGYWPPPDWPIANTLPPARSASGVGLSVWRWMVWGLTARVQGQNSGMQGLESQMKD